MKKALCILCLCADVTYAASPVQDSVVSSQHIQEVKTFEEAVIAAYQNNQEWQGNKIERAIASDNLAKAQMSFLPSINGDINLSKIKNERKPGVNRDIKEHSSATSTSLGISLRQNLFNGFATINSVKAYSNQDKAAFHKLKHMEQALIVNVLDEYSSIWYYRQCVEARRKMEANLKSIWNSQQSKLESGIGTSSDAAAAHSNYETAVYNRIQAETDLRSAEAKFEKRTGCRVAQGVELPQISVDIPHSLEQLIEQALSGNQSILYYRFSEKSSQNQLNAAKGKLAPSCDLEVGANRSLSTAPEKFERDYERSNNRYHATLSVRVPIFANSGGDIMDVKIARQQALRAKFAANDISQEVRKDCISNWNDYVSSNAMIEASRSAVNSAQLSSESYHEENELGMKSNTDVWDQENKLLAARIHLAESKKKRLMAAIKIAALTGTLDGNSLIKAQ